MNARDQLRGRLSFGGGFGGGGGMPVSLTVEPDQLQDRSIRPEDDVGKGPNRELTKLFPDGIEIRILAGRSGAKYSWERVYPSPGGTSKDAYLGSTFDSDSCAYEINGRTNVAADTIVFARFSRVGPHLIFSIGGSGSSGSWRHFKITSDEPDGYGRWTAKLLTNTAPIEYTTTIRVKLTPSGGSTFLVNRDYDGEEIDSVDGTSRTVSDGVTTSGSSTVTSSTGNFTSADLDSKISGTGIPDGSRITAINSTTSVSISSAATATGSSLTLTITPVFRCFQSRGADVLIIEYCVDGDDYCDRLTLPAPILLEKDIDCGEALGGALVFTESSNSQYMVAPSPMRI